MIIGMIIVGGYCGLLMLVLMVPVITFMVPVFCSEWAVCMRANPMIRVRVVMMQIFVVGFSLAGLCWLVCVL